jgi:phospholipase/carboxylesterase
VVSVPCGPVLLPDGSRAWWYVDPAKRLARLAAGPVDLFDRHPRGRTEARQSLSNALARLRQRWANLPVVMVGYSQGGMLAMDYLATNGPHGIAACALLSSSRIAFDEWEPSLSRLAGLRTLVAHGRQDDDLAFSAGENLRDCLLAAGAQVQWLPFEGGHELPLVVWRRLRKFVLDLDLPTNAG